MGITGKAVQYTSLGTGTTDTQLGGALFDVPEWAKMLLSVKVGICPLTPKADIGYSAKFMLKSDDVESLGPFTALCPPVSSGDATDIGPVIPPLAEYIVNCPVNGGEKLDLRGQMFVGDATANTYMGMTLIFGTAGAILPISRDSLRGVHRHAKIGTYTAVITAAKATGTNYELTGASRIVEAYGLVIAQTYTQSKPCIGKFTLTSSAFMLNPLSWVIEPVSSCTGATETSKVAGLSRLKDIDIGLKAPHVIITDTYDEVVGQNTDKFVTGVIYI